VQTALIYYQFITIYPFTEGNGRIIRNSDYAKIQSFDKATPVVLRVYEHIWSKPIVEVQHIVKELGLSYNTVAKAVNILVSLGIIQQFDGQKRYRKYAYTDLLDIFR